MADRFARPLCATRLKSTLVRQRLILSVPSDVDAAALSAVLQSDVAAVLLPADAPDLSGLVAQAQAAGVAALIDTDEAAWPAPHGADGLHVRDPFQARVEAVTARPSNATAGAWAETRHQAMTLGEAGADYVMFGAFDGSDPSACELAAWWQSLFEVPVVVAGASETEFDALMETGAEFIAVSDVFGDRAGAAARVAALNARLDEEAP
ncbi:MAG: thiamine phosphate synthase [Devosia sp.]